MSSVIFYPPGTAQWIACSHGSPIPINAIESGTDNGSIVYVARAYHNGALLPGKILSGHKACSVSWGGKEIAVTSYEVLVAEPGELKWENSSSGQLVRRAVVGGRTETGEQLYVGRFLFKGTKTPGKIQPSHQVCYIPFGGRVYSSQIYQILRG